MRFPFLWLFVIMNACTQGVFLMLEKMKYLRIPLPDSIENLKRCGDLKGAERLIEMKLQDPMVPSVMKERLLLEKEILSRYETEFPYSETEALDLIRKEIPDFTEDELGFYMDRGDACWHMINGKRHLQKAFCDSLKKVYPEIAARASVPSSASSLLDDMVQEMKQNGKAERRIRIRQTLRIKDEAFVPGRVLVHLPLPAVSCNMKDIRILKTEPEAVIDDENCECRTACFDVFLKENRTFAAEYEYTSSVTYHDCDPSLVTQKLNPQKEEEPQIVFTPLIRKLCGDLKGDETNPLLIAKRFYDFVTKNVIYSYMPQYILLGEIPEYCASNLRGDCGVQALLFITLCRCAGIKAQWQSGKYVTPEGTGNHDWAMFYCEPWGWLFADCSFGGSAWRAGNKERHAFYFTNLDPYRMAANNALMKEFTVPKKHWRIDPYDSQCGEAEYETRGLRHEELIFECDVLHMESV